MKISVRVKANSKVEKVEKTGPQDFLIALRARAKQGKANQRLIELLSGYFGTPKSMLTITRGVKCRNKIVEVAIS